MDLRSESLRLDRVMDEEYKRWYALLTDIENSIRELNDKLASTEN